MKNQTFNRVTLFSLILLYPAAGLSSQASPPLELLPAEGLGRERSEEEIEAFRSIETWRNFLSLNPNHGEAYYNLALAYLQLRNYQRALTEIDQALLLEHQNPKYTMLKSKTLMGLQRYNEAEKILWDLWEGNPAYHYAKIGVAAIEAVQGAYNRSLKRLEELREFIPDDKFLLLVTSSLHEQLEQPDTAERYLERALTLYPEDRNTQKISAEFYMRQAKFSEALARLNAFEELGPGTVESTVLKAKSNFFLGNYKEAEDSLRTFLARHPKHALGWYILGFSLRSLAEFENAIEALEVSVRLEPDNEIPQILIEDILLRDLNNSAYHKKYAARYHQKAERNINDLLYNQALHNLRMAIQLNPLEKESWLAFANMFRDQKLFYKYLDKLYTWRKYGPEGKETLREQINLYEASLPQSVAKRWGLAQYSYSNPYYPIRIFILQKKPTNYSGSVNALGNYFKNILRWYEQPAVQEEPIRVDSKTEIRKIKRSEKSPTPYYLLLDISDHNNAFTVSADIFVTETEERIYSLKTQKTGKEKIYRTFSQIAESIAGFFPKRARVIKTHMNEAVISMGRLSGVEAGQTWSLLSANQKTIGILKITAIDENISQGTIQLDSALVPLAEDDFAVLLDSAEETKEEDGEDTLPLPQKNLNLSLQEVFFTLSF